MSCSVDSMASSVRPADAVPPSYLLMKQEESRKWQVLWDDELKRDNRYTRYTRGVVLLLYFSKPLECGDLETEPEVNDLAAVLEEKYKFEIVKQAVSQKDKAGSEISKHLAEFRHKYNDDDAKNSLFIIYYAGHGWVSNERTGAFSIAGKKQANAKQTVPWDDIEFHIGKTEADVLLILDCCESGALSNSTRSRKRRYELLAACQAGKFTPAPGKNSFTRALIWALEQLEAERRFKTSKLFIKILEAPYFKDNDGQQPQLAPRFRLSGEQQENIEIQVIGHDDSDALRLGDSREEFESHVGNYIDLRFHLTHELDASVLGDIAQRVRSMLHALGFLRRVGFVKKGTSLAKVVKDAASAFRDPVERKKELRNGDLSASSTPLTPVTLHAQEHALAEALLSVGGQLSVPRVMVPTPGSSTAVSETDETMTTPLFLSVDEQPRDHISERRIPASLPAADDKGVRYHFAGLLRSIWSAFLASVGVRKRKDPELE
ncbi:hypothetical protein K402DRAFT_420622 [Aulographum hederae CBS 113979]|uniref:Peptidase C14 caspase domain-containing protein n=1 Tax=Aulographum hederae CBS 113979 TaxID=1176131 RepID=A0A6G1H171_9PEZI|nr:hypothetical protein K402DRAFT_420622 [Aulographum hederae CBS 113979]